MSIHVPYGFRFSFVDIFEAQAFIGRMRAHFAYEYQLSYARYFTALAVERFDDAILAKAGLVKPPAALASDIAPVMSVFREWTRLPEKERDELNAVLAADISIYIYPHRQSLYGEIGTENKEVFTHFLSQPEVADFSYQDKIVRPAGIAADEWKERAEIWNEIDAGALRRRAAAFSTTIANLDTTKTFPDKELIVSLIPPHAARVKDAATRMTMWAHGISSPDESVLQGLLDDPDSGHAEHLRLAAEMLPTRTTGIVFLGA